MAIMACVGIGGYVAYKKYYTDPCEIEGKYKHDVVYLGTYPREMTKQVPNLSPYCVKVETWLRMHHIEYEVFPARRRSRKNSTPYIFFNGKEYSDSNFIIDFLTDYFKLDPTDGLSPEMQGVARAYGKMVDENTSWTYMLYRFVWHQPSFARVFRPQGPWFLSEILRRNIGRYIKEKAIYHGIGRNTPEEIEEIARRDLRAISNWLGKKNFFMGDKATKVDATIFGHLCQVAYVDMPYPHKKIMRDDYPNLLDYLDRVKSEYWSDWEEIVDQSNFC